MYPATLSAVWTMTSRPRHHTASRFATFSAVVVVFIVMIGTVEVPDHDVPALREV